MEQISWVGMDTSKRVFQVHGVSASEQPVLRRTLSRDGMVTFFRGMAPTVARTLDAMGRTVRLIAPQLAKPCVGTARTTPPTRPPRARR